MYLVGCYKVSRFFEVLLVYHIQIGPRRSGDLPDVWADVNKAENVLHCQATRSLEDMYRDAWNWQCKNPNGYEG